MNVHRLVMLVLLFLPAGHASAQDELLQAAFRGVAEIGKQVPVYLWSAEYDPAGIETSVPEMYAKLCRKYAACPMYTQWQG